MQLNRSELVKVLDLVKPAVSAKDNNMQQDCFVFHDGHILTYNDDMAIHHILYEEMDELENLIVPAKEFYALINRLTSETIDLNVADDCIEIKAGRAKAKLKTQREIKMPLNELCDWQIKGNPTPKELSKALSLVAPACGKNMTQPLTTCVFFNGNYVVATDNYCCARYKFKNFEWLNPFYIPQSTVNTLAKYEPESYVVKSNGWVRFGLDDMACLIDCRTYYEGQPFAEVNSLFDEKGDEFVFPAKLTDALERAGVFVKDAKADALTEDPFVQISLEKDKLIINGKGIAGEYSENMRVGYNGKPRSFLINTSLLTRVLQEKYKCEICSRFVHIYDKNYDYVVVYKDA